MPNNIFQQRIKPVSPKVLANERVFVYVPRATTSEPGIAYYNPEDFTVSNLGQVSIIWPYAHEGGFGLVQIAPDAAGYLEFTDDENHYLQVAIDELDVHVNELIDVKVAAHNIDTTAHQDIRNLIVTRIAAHNTSSTAHQDIRAMLNSLQSQIDNIDLNTEGLIEEHNTSPTAHDDIRDLIDTKVNKQVISDNGTFIIWNTEEGLQLSAAKDDKAQKLNVTPDNININGDIIATESSVNAKIEALNSIEIRNIAPNLVIQATEANVQSVATQYIVDNYSRNPETNDGLYITRTDLDNDVIQYAYFNNVWVNVGMNKVDLSNYVDLTSAQNISGAKNFAGGLTKNGKDVLTVDDSFDLQDLPQFTNKLEIDLSYAPSLNGLVTFPIVSSSNFYVNWGDGTGTYYQEATTSMSHQYSDTEFAGWISIYGDWQGIVFGPDDNDNKLILINIEYDSNITNMPECPLYNCVNLKSIRFSENITLRGYAFYGCENLTSVTLPNSAIIPTNSNGAHFYNCENLTEFEIPKGTIRIPNSFLRGCTNLKSINIPEGVTQIQTYAFMQTGITSVIIPDSATRLYGSTFLLCDKLKHVKIGSGLTQTLDNEFSSCYNIEDVTITALTPPTIQGNIFFNNDTFLLFVKSESLQAYKTATNWTQYADRTYPIGGNYTESITIPSTSWDAETKTVTVTAIGATSEDRNVVMPSIPSEYDDYGIRCTAQGTMTLTFTCETVPTEDVTIGVAYILTNQ